MKHGDIRADQDGVEAAILGKLIGANFNSTADRDLLLFGPTFEHKVWQTLWCAQCMTGF